MRMTSIFLSIFAAVLFAGVASAQSGKLYVATDVGVFVPLVQSGSIPTVNLVAGKPIRVRFGGADGTGKTMTGALLGKIQTTQVPCNATAGAGTTQQEYFINQTKPNYVMGTSSAWRGTCSVLSVKLGEQKEYLVKIRFQ